MAPIATRTSTPPCTTTCSSKSLWIITANDAYSGPVLPVSVHPDALVTGRVDARGVHLSLAAYGLSLFVPDGAVAHPADLFMAVVDGAEVVQESGQQLLSPCVCLGPAHVLLRKPVVLTVGHSAALGADWDLAVHTAAEEQAWTCALRCGRETINTPLYCQLREQTAHLVLDQLLSVSLVGTATGASASRRMLLVAFVRQQSIHVYLMADDGGAALERALGEESSADGRQVSPVMPASLLVHADVIVQCGANRLQIASKDLRQPLTLITLPVGAQSVDVLQAQGTRYSLPILPHGQQPPRPLSAPTTITVSH